MINYMMQNSKGKTPAMSYSVPVHSKYIENIPARTFSKSQMDTFQLKPEEQLDRKDLLMTLNAYITQKLSAKTLDGHSSVSRTKETSPYDNRVKPLHIDQFDGIISKEKLGGFEMKPQFLQRPVSELVSGSTQNDLKLSLTPIDGKGFIYIIYVCMLILFLFLFPFNSVIFKLCSGNPGII